MAHKRKTWTEKLHDNKDLPRVFTIEGKMVGRWGSKAGDTCVIPSPREVDALMKKVPKGKVVTINDLRAALARRHRTTLACPITTGIFSWIAAHAAEESAKAKSAKPLTPYWRTLKNGGELNPKYPGGTTALGAELRAEGHTIMKKGKRTFIADYQDAVAALA